jgi:integrase
VRTIFSLKNAVKPVLRTLSEQNSAKVKYPHKVSYYNLEAKVYKAKDGFHAVWVADGKRKKQQFKRLKDARAAALNALKLIHKGQGEAANLSPTELNKLITAKKLLREAGFADPVSVAHEYIAAKAKADQADLSEVSKFWASTRGGIRTVSFEAAANDWFKTHQHRWAKTTKRLNKGLKNALVGCFQVNACDVSFEIVHLFFDEEVHARSPKYRNHYRATLKSIIAHCVDRCWLNEKHGLNSLLKKEPDAPENIEVISPAKFRELLKAADTETLPLIALQGFTGVRRSEALRLKWEDVWGTDGFVVLNASQTKTSKRRLVERGPALEEWLKPYRRFTGPIWARSEDAFSHIMKGLRKQVRISHIKNPLRHSYATYKLAVKRDANALALEMGNSPQILMRNYLQLATPNQGRQWFGILPMSAAKAKLVRAS